MIAINHSRADELPWNVSMAEAAELLWRMNNEYRARLAKAQRSLDLLTQLLHARVRPDVGPLLETFEAMHQTLAALADEHRDWRYRYFYEAQGERRMVQDDLSANRALAAFSRMHARQQRDIHALLDAMNALPQPESMLTSVANGDLWMLTVQAIADLANFEDYLHSNVA